VARSVDEPLQRESIDAAVDDSHRTADGIRDMGAKVPVVRQYEQPCVTLRQGPGQQRLIRQVRVFESAGNEVANNDSGNDPDTGLSLQDAVLYFAASVAGTYYVGVSASESDNYNPATANSGVSGSQGAYRLQVLLQNNSLPIAVDDNATTELNTAVVISILANDSDPDNDSLEIVSVGQGANGATSFTTDPQTGEVLVTYTPNTDFIGYDTSTYVVADEHGAQTTGTVQVGVGNTPPVAVNDNYAAIADDILTISVSNGVLSNDTDAENQALSAAVVQDAEHGTLNFSSDGSFTYTPDAGYVGSDSFTYQVMDAGGETSSIATVSIEVFAGPVIAEDDFFSIAHNQVLTVAAPGLLENDWDFEDDSLTISVVSTVSHGQLSWQSDGSFIYTPDANFAGTDEFHYRVSDGIATSTAATVVIDVTKNRPTGIDLVYSTDHGAALSIAAPGVLATAVDADGDPHHLEADGGPTGSIEFGNNYYYDGGDPASFSTDSFHYTPPQMPVTNIAPIAVADGHVKVVHGQTLTISQSALLFNDRDPHGSGGVSIAEFDAGSANVSRDANGDFVFVSTGATYQPGIYSFTYSVTDGDLESSMAKVTIEVTNEPPGGYDQWIVIDVNNHNGPDDDTFIVFGTGFSDPDGDDLTIDISPEEGNLSLTSGYYYYYGSSGDMLRFDIPPELLETGSGSYYYYDNGWSGAATFSYALTATDPLGRTKTTEVVIIVTDQPQDHYQRIRASDDQFTWLGGTLTGHVMGNDWAYDPLWTRTVSLNNGPSFGEFEPRFFPR
jgi:VCBS repeat-containing protein